MKTLFIFATLISSLSCQASTLTCTRDLRGSDGTFTQLVLSEKESGKFQVELSWKAGGLCPTGPCRGGEKVVVSENLDCVFGPAGSMLADCYKSDESGNSYLSVAGVTTTRLDAYTHEVKQSQTISTSVGSPLASSLSSKALKSLLDHTWDAKQCTFAP